MKTFNISIFLSLFSSLSVLLMGIYVLWTLDAMILEQSQLIELDAIFGNVDPVKVQQLEWLQNNGKVVAALGAAGSFLTILSSVYLLQKKRKGVLLMIVGSLVITAAMFMSIHIYPLFSSVILLFYILMLTSVIFNRNKLV